METSKQKTTNRSMDLLTAVEQIVEKANGSGLSQSSIAKQTDTLSMWLRTFPRTGRHDGFVHQQHPRHPYPSKGIRRVPRM